MSETITLRSDDRGNLLDGQVPNEEFAEILEVLQVALEADRLSEVEPRPRAAPPGAAVETAHRRRCFALIDEYLSSQGASWALRSEVHQADRVVSGITVHVAGSQPDAMEIMSLRHGHALFSTLMLTLPRREHREQAYSLYHALLTLGVRPRTAAWNARQFCASFRREGAGGWTYWSRGEWLHVADAGADLATAAAAYAQKVVQSSQRAPDAPLSIDGGPHPRELGPRVTVCRVGKDASAPPSIETTGFGPADKLVVDTPRGRSVISSPDVTTQGKLSLDVSGPAAAGGDDVDAILSAYGASLVERDAVRETRGKREDELGGRILQIAGVCAYNDFVSRKLAHVIHWRDDETLLPTRLTHARLYAAVRAIQYVPAETR